MKNGLKKIMRIGLLCFASLMQASSASFEIPAAPEKSFDDLTLDGSCRFIETVVEDAEKMRYGTRLLLSKKIDPGVADDDKEIVSYGKDKSKVCFYRCNSAINKALESLFSDRALRRSQTKKQDQLYRAKSLFLLQFLEDHFDDLSADVLIALTSHILSSMPERIIYFKRLMESKKVVCMDENKIESLCKDLLPEQKTFFATTLLERFFENSSAFIIVELVSRITEKDGWKDKCWSVLLEKPRKKYLRYLIASGKLEKEADLNPIFERLLSDENEYVASILKEKLHELSHSSALAVVVFLPDAEKDAWLKENDLFWRACCCDDPKAKGPLFSTEFRLKKSKYIIELVLREMKRSCWHDPQYDRHFREMMPKVTQFVKEQYQQDRIVFFHGQNDLWGYLGMVFDMLAGIKNGQPVPEGFVRLSLHEKPLFESNDQVADIRKRGIVHGERKYTWRHILCTNLHLLANYKDKNSLMFVFRNYDMTTARGVDIEWMVEQMATEVDMLPEYEKLIKDEPKLFVKLHALYRKDIVARGNFGRLVVISMPKEVATRLAYSSTTGGELRSYYPGNEDTTDVVKVAEYYGDIGHENEHVVIMSEEITNPYKAAQAGIRMAVFTTDANEESVPLALTYKKEFDVAKARMSAFHDEKKEQVRNFRTSCPFALSYNPFAVVGVVKGVKMQVQKDDDVVGAESDYTLVD